MRKTFAFILALILSLGISAPASAAESLDSRLTKVTLAVKNTLDIPDTFDAFYGSLSEDVYAPFWSLYWSNEIEQLNVTANESGKVFMYQYDSREDNDYPVTFYYRSLFDPIFPKVTRKMAKPYAEAFIAKVLTAGESVELEERNESPSNERYYSYSGTLKINGLDSPFSVYVTVRTADLKITDFSRSDLYTSVQGTLPSPEASITPDKASEILSDTYELEPLYVVTDQEKPAHVVYVPQHSMTSVVDAKTGEIVSTSLYYPLYGGRGLADTAEAGMKADHNAGLTPTELLGISKLEGVYTGEELDTMLRSRAILGVTDEFSFTGVNYYVDNETDEVTARIDYWAEGQNPEVYGAFSDNSSQTSVPDNTLSIYKSFELDAKTGILKNVYTYYNGKYDEAIDAQANPLDSAVESWMKTNFSDAFSACELYFSSAASNIVAQDSYTYCQKVNGYFYTGNSMNVTVNTFTGTIDNFSMYWNDEISFAPADDVISVDSALNTYAEAYMFTLGYTLKPIEERTDYSGYYPAVYEIILSYSPVFDGYITGVDAITGELISERYETGDMIIIYNDIGSSYARAKIEALAEYGIGFYADSFKPTLGLTEKDMILLLLSASGYRYLYDDIDDNSLDRIYQSAYSLGILPRDQRSPERPVTRIEMVRTLVGITTYAQAAEIKGIFDCGFTDDGDISDSDYGYAAIAKGLKIISGNTDGTFRPNETITRQEAAVMLYNFMSRDS
ncbi:MAG: S-layer homology domain-containing protein [Clostridiales bacterium]|jgi:hypothetical protein|nr:S-layer homology domain-containing protein [Clostridiales bacterium]